MKSRYAYGIGMILVVLLGMCKVVQAEELPFQVQAEYLETEDELLIRVIARESVVLQAYTFAIVFDNRVYQLYKGYDEIENGYGYSQQFQQQYQNGGMFVSNALDDRVLFSGVNQSDEGAAYEGVIAQAALLRYASSVHVDSEPYVEILAMHLNGKTVDLTDENKRIFCETGDSRTEGDSALAPSDSMEHVPSESSEEGSHKSVVQTPEHGMETSRPSDPSAAEVPSATEGAAAGEAMQKAEITMVSKQAVSEEAAGLTEAVSASEEVSNPGGQNKMIAILFKWLGGMTAIGVVTAISIIFFIKKRKRSE